MMKCIKNLFSKFFKKRYHGSHVFGDFIWNVKEENINDRELAYTIFEIMHEAVKTTKMTIVHSKLCILGEIESSPPGFTSVVLIDESHITSHCYSDKGWLAIDCFTCSDTDPVPIMNYIIKEIKHFYPSLECTYMKRHKRFHYK